MKQNLAYKMFYSNKEINLQEVKAAAIQRVDDSINLIVIAKVQLNTDIKLILLKAALPKTEEGFSEDCKFEHIDPSDLIKDYPLYAIDFLENFHNEKGDDIGKFDSFLLLIDKYTLTDYIFLSKTDFDKNVKLSEKVSSLPISLIENDSRALIFSLEWMISNFIFEKHIIEKVNNKIGNPWDYFSVERKKAEDIILMKHINELKELKRKFYEFGDFKEDVQ